MKPHAELSMVIDLMTEFATLTGLSPLGKTPRRYLWTDAFAVCNFLQLYCQTQQEQYKKLALLLVDQVHHTLGRHRDNDSRTGWISGLDEREGELHPTQRGLRIGKKMAERGPAEAIDESLEWDRDGQYYHYLTKWMHALNRVSQVTKDMTYNRWAVELAKTAHARFTYMPSLAGQKAMYWKMSIDLSRPLVTSMGQHDPLDGFITYNELQMCSNRSETSLCLVLSEEINNMAAICQGKSWLTDDTLGIGGLLCDAYKIAQIMVSRDIEQTGLLETMLDSSLKGLEYFAQINALNYPLDYRLAFRELGLSIGLRAVARLHELIEEQPGRFQNNRSLHQRTEMLLQYTQVLETIENFWLESDHRASKNWLEHRDINMVMLATSLAPDGFLAI